MKQSEDIAENYSISRWASHVIQSFTRPQFQSRHLIIPAVLFALSVAVDIWRFGSLTSGDPLTGPAETAFSHHSPGESKSMKAVLLDNAFRSFGVYWVVLLVFTCRARSSPRFDGDIEVERAKNGQGEQGGIGQPATRPELKPEIATQSKPSD